MFAILLIIAAYFIGAIPFGYLIARSKGIDLFKVGSGNIGATNVGRALGRQFAILVFILDFLKGAGPVAVVPVLVNSLPPDDAQQLQPIDLLRVGVALAAFLGHLFPIYLKFRGGKGVATGAGTVFILVPGPAGIGLLVWLAVVSSSRLVSLASIAAALTLGTARLVFTASPFGSDSFILTVFCLVAIATVILKHRENLRRIRQGTENRIEARSTMATLSSTLHLLALGLLFGGSVFFNFVAAPTIFKTFHEVAMSPASDRTAYVTINENLGEDKKDQLGKALAGAAVGPIFPLFFGMQGICAVVALLTALSWWKLPSKANRWRVIVIGLALVSIVAGWPISQRVTELRLARFSPDPAIAKAAIADFGVWHLYSLGLSFVTAIAAFVAMILAAKIPLSDSSSISISRNEEVNEEGGKAIAPPPGLAGPRPGL